MFRFNGHRFLLFPLLAAWYSVLALATGNLEAGREINYLEAALLAATVVGLLGWFLSGFLSREPDRRTVLSILFVVWFAGRGTVIGPLRDAGAFPGLSFALTLALLTGLGALVLRAGPVVHSVARFLRVMVLILIMFPLFSFTLIHLQEWTAASAVKQNVSPVRGVAPPGAPNIFLIVLDKYTGSRSLLKNYDFDNSAFEQQLRSRGFVIPRETRSNYPHTSMTLASMLNWSFIEELHNGAPTKSTHDLNRAIEDNRTWRFLMERGYEFVFLPSTFQSTRSNAFADRQIPDALRSGVNIAAAWIASSAAYRLPSALGTGFRFPYPVESAGDYEAKFELLHQLAAESGPLFVFAHLLLPHEPYIFEADCTHREPYWPATDYVEDQRPIRDAYVVQIRCVNNKLDDLVGSILDASQIPPIILLQSDHGHGMMALNPMRGSQLPKDQLDPVQIAERTDIFAAYHLPHGGHVVIYDSITPVNVLPAIFTYYFDANIALKDDAVYWARLHPPFELTRIR